VTPVSPTCCFQLVLICRVISIMRRATTLGYFSSDSSWSGLWQKSQPCSGDTQVVKACIRRENSVALMSPSTLTLTNTSLAGGESVSAGSSGAGMVLLASEAATAAGRLIWICEVPAGPRWSDTLRSQPASSSADASSSPSGPNPAANLAAATPALRAGSPTNSIFVSSMARALRMAPGGLQAALRSLKLRHQPSGGTMRLKNEQPPIGSPGLPL
jgi:hypothetical protein